MEPFDNGNAGLCRTPALPAAPPSEASSSTTSTARCPTPTTRGGPSSTIWTANTG